MTSKSSTVAEMEPVVARTGARFVAYPPALTAGDFVTTLKNGNLVVLHGHDAEGDAAAG